MSHLYIVFPDGASMNINCEICMKRIKSKDMKNHYSHKHSNIVNIKTLVNKQSLQTGGTGKCIELTTIIKKDYSHTYFITDKVTGFKYIVKKGKYIEDEYFAYVRLGLMSSRMVRMCLPKIYSFFYKDGNPVMIQEYINGYSGYDLDKIDIFVDKNKPKKTEYAWLLFLLKIAYFINELEENKIQHNDFYLGNIIITYDKTNKKFDTYVIDMETMIDYKRREYPLMIKSALKNKKELVRMGWNKKFHIGSDLNQMLGEILEKYQNIMPGTIYDILKPFIIVQDKEFPYAISGKNDKTSGKEIMILLYHLFMKKHKVGIKKLFSDNFVID